MVVGSYVVNVSPETERRLAKTPRMHRMIMGGLMGLGIAFGLSGFINSSADSPRLEIFAGKGGAEIQAFSSGDETNFSILEEGQAADLQRLESVLLENDEYFTVDVNHVTRILMEDTSQLRDLRIELWARTSCEANRDYCQALIMETAEIAFEQLDFIKELDGMRITVVNRFDLGLSGDSYSQSIDWRMADWKVELAK